jgi:hypothetical protein
MTQSQEVCLWSILFLQTVIIVDLEMCFFLPLLFPLSRSAGGNIPHSA